MDFNIPILDQLSACKSLLIAGIGGGFDIFCGLPIYYELKKRGKNVHLANFSFSDGHAKSMKPTATNPDPIAKPDLNMWNADR